VKKRNIIVGGKIMMNNCLHDETVEKLAENPFITSFYYHLNFYEEIPKLGKTVEKLKGNENFTKSKILYAMFEYAKIYEQFRPNRITKNDTYFGTVNKMDGIYFTLFKFIDADLLITFSRSSVTDLDIQFTTAPKRAYKDINWEEMIDDIREIDKAILITMEEHAVDLYCILHNNAPIYIWKLVKGYILRFGENIKKEDIDFQKDSIFIKNKKLTFQNHHQLLGTIFKISDALKDNDKNLKN
jgi:hypothetical protein